MKSITIHKIDDETERALLEIAEREGISLNKLIKRLLRESLGLDDQLVDHRADFEEFFGVWTSEEADAFARRVSVFDEIEDQEWE